MTQKCTFERNFKKRTQQNFLIVPSQLENLTAKKTAIKKGDSTNWVNTFTNKNMWQYPKNR